MTEYFVESWPPADPKDRTRTYCRDWREADAHAWEIAQGGDNAVVFHVESSYMAVPVDRDAHNGVRPARPIGLADCELNPSRYAVAWM